MFQNVFLLCFVVEQFFCLQNGSFLFFSILEDVYHHRLYQLSTISLYLWCASSKLNFYSCDFWALFSFFFHYFPTQHEMTRCLRLACVWVGECVCLFRCGFHRNWFNLYWQFSSDSFFLAFASWMLFFPSLKVHFFLRPFFVQSPLECYWILCE